MRRAGCHSRGKGPNFAKHKTVLPRSQKCGSGYPHGKNCFSAVTILRIWESLCAVEQKSKARCPFERVGVFFDGVALVLSGSTNGFHLHLLHHLERRRNQKTVITRNILKNGKTRKATFGEGQNGLGERSHTLTPSPGHVLGSI